ncbi:DNA-3-methyladenine glycosylase [Seminavis robusta]|uniref:DNA-3-methyladenine glycosylase n=1 Tax=Seminavis robusta TaxID=568900 RepID=A0A9N8DJI4_9STRA|nr:DNA-3-methyladenine glycosylase [Seminavis robusta]|eukprot:Sro116_g057030.1 DNA-3-methyladenine glycosylase (2331) ;mRNA; r:41947-48939
MTTPAVRRSRRGPKPRRSFGADAEMVGPAAATTASIKHPIQGNNTEALTVESHTKSTTEVTGNGSKRGVVVSPDVSAASSNAMKTLKESTNDMEIVDGSSSGSTDDEDEDGQELIRDLIKRKRKDRSEASDLEEEGESDADLLHQSYSFSPDDFSDDDERDDELILDLVERKRNMNQSSVHVVASTPRTRNKSKMISNVVTPTPSEHQQTKHLDLAAKEEDDGYNTSDMEEEASRSDDDEEFLSNLEKDEKKTSVPVTPSPAKKKKPSSPAKKTPSDRNKKKTPTKRAPSQKDKKKLNPRSIAVRGLPRGSLGKCPISGFTIRTLDGIKPFVAASCDWSLPGRLLVVAAPDPPSLQNAVGKTFDSAQDLHQHLQKIVTDEERILVPKATYDMEAVADPTFTSWEFAKARLNAAGLIPDGNEIIEQEEDNNQKRKSNNLQKGPIVVVIQWDGNAKVTASVCHYTDMLDANNKSVEALQWAIIENGEGRELPPVLVGAPESLIHHQQSDLGDDEGEGDDDDTIAVDTGKNLIPTPSKQVVNIKLPASLLEKSIRRAAGSTQQGGICTIAPLLDASASLLLRRRAHNNNNNNQHPLPGSTLAFLKTVWGCMLVDAAPFDDADDCLGLPGLLVLSLVAKANPDWTLPPPLNRLSVAAAIRAATAPSNQWVGFVKRREDWWQLEDMPATKDTEDELDSPRAVLLRNVLRATQVAVGGRVAWGKWNSFVGDTSAGAAIAYLNDDDWDGSVLPPAPGPSISGEDESKILAAWEQGRSPSIPPELRLKKLDHECRLSAIDPTAMPSTLVLLQALLQQPPTHWKKHSLPALSKHIRKLISNVNPRDQESVQLLRLATWGTKKQTKSKSPPPQTADTPTAAGNTAVESFREVVTNTGELSEKEAELVDCYEAIQNLQLKGLFQQLQPTANPATETSSATIPDGVVSFPATVRVQAGKPVSAFDGRVAFLLAFASAVEVQVSPDGTDGKKETVSAMFCGDPDEPLLVQRIGKARKDGKELAGGSKSGATAVPSLGYVQRTRSKEEARLMEAAELEVAKYWKGGLTMPLPLPALGVQWELGRNKSEGAKNEDWEEAEKSVTRTAEFVDNGSGKKTWRFTIAGVEVEPFDARPVVSPCALDLDDPSIKPVPIEPGSGRARLLRVAFYVEGAASVEESQTPSHAEALLESMSALHDLACAYRLSSPDRPCEGLIYDWLPLTALSPVPSRTWRDVLLAIRTREQDHVVLGRGIRPDGSGAPGDMTEGVVLRLFHALESLYPTVLKKFGAFKFSIRPRGAAFYHLLACLELLGRGEAKSQQNVTSAECSPGLLEADNSGKGLAKSDVPGKNRSGSNGQSPKEAESATPSRKRRKRGIDSAVSSRSPQPTKRPKRAAAASAMKKTSNLFAGDHGRKTGREKKPTTREADSDCSDHSVCDEDLLPKEYLPVPKVTTELWLHQEASVSKVVQGVQEGKRGHADASAVGAGKTLTALATIARLAQWIEDSGGSRHGVLVMLPTKALIKEWLLEIATHTAGFHVVEQREDGTLFSMTYGKKNPPIDGNSLIISTLDRVCRNPFLRQSAWDFVVIDECLSVQNASAKRAPSAWRQIEVSMCGVLMLSATFFRSKYDSLFYMIRMLRSPLPRTMEWLPATIHEHIVCQIPETDRTWTMEAEMVKLPPEVLRLYRTKVDTYGRLQLNDPGKVDGRKLWTSLGSFLRTHYEGRDGARYGRKSIMGDAIIKVANKLLRKKRRPLVFADTEPEATHLVTVMTKARIPAQMWKDVAAERIANSSRGKNDAKKNENGVIVAVKSIEGQGINMQHHADCIICRPTEGDLLEQMKGRVDRPGQTEKQLLLVVIVAEHTIEEAKFANIRLAGNFFRQYIAPVAKKYRERVDLEATLAAGGKKQLKKGTVTKKWRETLQDAGNSGSFARLLDKGGNDMDDEPNEDMMAEVTEEEDMNGKAKPAAADDEDKPLNKVLVNKGDPVAVRQAKEDAKNGRASLAVRQWLFPPKPTAQKGLKKNGERPLAKVSLLRFSDTTPPLILNHETVQKGVSHLMAKDAKLRAILARVGAVALANDVGEPKDLSQGRFFDQCLRSITFTQISVEAGESFMRRLAIKAGICLERKHTAAGTLDASTTAYLAPFLEGRSRDVVFTHALLRPLVDECKIKQGKRTGWPHLCGPTHPCGMRDDPQVFLNKARENSTGISAGYSNTKASFIISLVEDFESGKVSAEKISKASDREAARMLTSLRGIGDWSAGGVLMFFLRRADIMLYGDLTVRNYLNDLYDINHNHASETLVESAADFADNGENRNLMDALAKERGWEPYRSVVTLLMYHLQEENLILV